MDELNEILKFPETKEECFNAWKHIVEHGFIFNYFTLIIDDPRFIYSEHFKQGQKLPKHTYKVKVIGLGDDQKISVKLIYERPDGMMANKTVETDVSEWLKSITNIVKDISHEKDWRNWDVNNIGVDVLPAMMFMQYAVIKSINREVVEMPVTKRKYKPMSERKQSKPKEEYKLFDVIRKYSKHINHNKHHYSCEAWEVKGHFRHYKNGKTVWVKPFTKGKGKVKEKEYKL